MAESYFNVARGMQVEARCVHAGIQDEDVNDNMFLVLGGDNKVTYHLTLPGSQFKHQNPRRRVRGHVVPLAPKDARLV